MKHCRTSVEEAVDIAIVLDSPDERWPSMDLVGEMLMQQWLRAPAEVRATPIVLGIPRMARRLRGAAGSRAAFNIDRALIRYVAYPARALAARRRERLFHVADHSYAAVVHALVPRGVGIYCHDLDAIRPVLEGSLRPRGVHARAQLAIARVLHRALQAAAVVFHSTCAVGDALEHHRVVPRSRLVHAPYGVAAEFSAIPNAIDGAAHRQSRIHGPYLLHVGSGIPRKRLDVLFEVFARVRARRPGLRLVQQGAALSDPQKAHVQRLAIGDALVQPPRLARVELARLYRGASLVLVTSDSEGFGLPIAEALACGATVVASDIPVLREVGGRAVLYAPPGDVEAWVAVVESALTGSRAVPDIAARLGHAKEFSWESHARTILDAYKELAACDRSP